MVRIVRKLDGTILKDGFNSFSEADEWYEDWCDTMKVDYLSTVYVGVTFENYEGENS